jgi:hypothetical protein
VEQRATWTDERLDDLAEAMRSGFARVDADIRDLRAEMHEGFASVRAELGGEIRALRNTMFAFGGGIIIALIGVIGAILARGA